MKRTGLHSMCLRGVTLLTLAKDQLLTLLLLAVCLSATGQNKKTLAAYQEALSRGLNERGVYTIDRDKKLSSKDWYELTRRTHNGIIIVHQESTPTHKLLKAEFTDKEHFMETICRQMNVNAGPLKNSGKAYLVNRIDVWHKSAEFMEAMDAQWTSDLKDGFIDGEGAGIVQNGNEYYYISGKFLRGLPISDFEVTIFTLEPEADWVPRHLKRKEFGRWDNPWEVRSIYSYSLLDRWSLGGGLNQVRKEHERQYHDEEFRKSLELVVPTTYEKQYKEEFEKYYNEAISKSLDEFLTQYKNENDEKRKAFMFYSILTKTFCDDFHYDPDGKFKFFNAYISLLDLNRRFNQGDGSLYYSKSFNLFGYSYDWVGYEPFNKNILIPLEEYFQSEIRTNKSGHRTQCTEGLARLKQMREWYLANEYDKKVEMAKKNKITADNFDSFVSSLGKSSSSSGKSDNSSSSTSSSSSSSSSSSVDVESLSMPSYKFTTDWLHEDFIGAGSKATNEGGENQVRQIEFENGKYRGKIKRVVGSNGYWAVGDTRYRTLDDAIIAEYAYQKYGKRREKGRW